MRSFHVVACALLLGSAAVSEAATPAGAIVCTGSAGALSFNVSFFDIGLANPTDVGSSSSGAGAGKVTFQPFVIHAALSSFPKLFEAAATGTHFSSCTLTTQDSSGGSMEFRLSQVLVQSVNAIASSATSHAPRFAYVKADMAFGAVEVRTSTGVDDGGSSPNSSGWNRVTNSGS
ncbi:MAG TPA: type VI secretion system tube protein Hcp [Steroidobacteraceae bacterium]|nr:type VI secretion system tube protein Hcp [Steroidobacteraceae bacterium]